jgi:hypothetical protein
MQFVQRNRYFLLTVAVLFLAALLAVRQQMINSSSHAREVEDFLLLHDRNEIKACEHIYQVLIQQLPRLPERDLVLDLERTAMVVDPKTPQLQNLVWKYYVSLNNELRHRSEKRLQALLQSSGKD